MALRQLNTAAGRQIPSATDGASHTHLWHWEAREQASLQTPTHLVISPHLDDAVLSCGAFLAQAPGSLVVTVFAGMPGAEVGLPAWDYECGFRNARDAVWARIVEDESALASLDCQGQRLNFLARQYHDGPDEIEQIARAIGHAIDVAAPDSVLFPLGLSHPDHAATHAACRRLIASHPDVRWLIYADDIHHPNQATMDQRLHDLGEEGCFLARVPLFSGLTDVWASKRLAIQEYTSQLTAIGAKGLADALGTELYWRIQLGPVGENGARWERRAAIRTEYPSLEG